MSLFSSMWQSEHFSFLGVNNQANLSDMRCRTTFYTALGRLLMVDLGKGVPIIVHISNSQWAGLKSSDMCEIEHKCHVKEHLLRCSVFDRWGWGPIWTVHASSHCCVWSRSSDVQHQHLQWTRSKSEMPFFIVADLYNT